METTRSRAIWFAACLMAAFIGGGSAITAQGDSGGTYHLTSRSAENSMRTMYPCQTISRVLVKSSRILTLPEDRIPRFQAQRTSTRC